MSGAVVFDAYGTLFDVHSALAGACEGADHGERAASLDALSQIWRQKQLEYMWVRTLSGRYRDFRALTGDALRVAMAMLGIDDADMAAAAMAAYERLGVYGDVRGALEVLGRRGVRRAIFTNGSVAMIDSAVESAGLSALIDEVITVEPVSAYKTHPGTYALIPDSLGEESFLFVSSNRWDIAGAVACGIRSVWLNRTGMPDEYPDLAPEAILSDLGALPDLASMTGTKDT